MTTKKTIANARNSFNAKNKAAAEENKVVASAEVKDTKVADTKKVETVKEEAKKPAVKAEDTKKPEVKKEVAKKTEAKKPAAKKTVKKEITQTVYVQYAGKNVAIGEMMPRIKKVWQKAGNRIKDIKDVKLYVKPEDNKVYFVINNGDFCDSVDFE